MADWSAVLLAMWGGMALLVDGFVRFFRRIMRRFRLGFSSCLLLLVVVGEEVAVSCFGGEEVLTWSSIMARVKKWWEMGEQL